MIKFIQEIRGFIRYYKSIEKLKQDELYKKFDFASGWVNQIGAVTLIHNNDCSDHNGDYQESLMKMYMVDYYNQFIKKMEYYGIPTSEIGVTLDRYNRVQNIDPQYFPAYIKFEYTWRTIPNII